MKTKSDCGAINVPLAILWVEPGLKRSHDQLILGESTFPSMWADGMDDEMRLWLVGKVESHALCGERVVILGQQGDWLQVAAVEQPTNRNKLGYPGWIPAVQISQNTNFMTAQVARPLITVVATKATLYLDPSCKLVAGQLSYQTKLPYLQEAESTLAVLLPNGATGYLTRDAVHLPASSPLITQRLVGQARRFLGLSYIWGGTSAYGFDCSGFTFRLYQSQGIPIPRDADEQAHYGLPVEKADLVPGDLLFFADTAGQGSIHHVGLFIGNNSMIHAPNSRSQVREDSFAQGTYSQEYWGARRYR